MPVLLHVSASPREERSQSALVARAFVESLSDTKKDLQVAELDLWDTTLPPIDGALLDAKAAAMRGLPQSPEQAARWQEIISFTEPLRAADYLLFSVPMWNWSIPYVLKYYIDVVTQPGQLFSWSPETSYIGLLRSRAVVVYSSSFSYDAGSPHEGFDFQKSYFEHWLSIVGIQLAGTVTIAPTAGAPERVAQAREAAVARARSLAERL